ncbi:TonB family protein [Marinospirillum perlucidum]|uniref:TonB family protein n=1 Tax=Marinospirillum perlucidum TaxID=1982602 RepID=UPI000DF174B3|nr:TonB family protein [Marinospirillum perlucidum]
MKPRFLLIWIAAPLSLLGVALFFAGLSWMIQPPSGEMQVPQRLSLNWAEVTPEPPTQDIQPPPPPPPEPPAPQQPQQSLDTSTTSSSPLDSPLALDASVPSLDANLLAGASTSALPEGIQVQATPVHREQPRYPRHALSRRIEGWVELGFSVDAEGEVIPESIEILASRPEGVFDRAARRAIARWRFASHELGEGETRLKQRLEFRLESNG